MKLTSNRTRELKDGLFARANKAASLNVIGCKAPGANMLMSMPRTKASKKATKLTISADGTRLDLNGRQVKALRKLLATANKVTA
jgi:hypothetical protein